MLDIDVDEIQEIEYLNSSTSEQGAVKITLETAAPAPMRDPMFLKFWKF